MRTDRAIQSMREAEQRQLSGVSASRFVAGVEWEDAAVEEMPTYRGQARALLIDLIEGDS